MGIAGYEEGYRQVSKNINVDHGVNPHNQYLLFLTQMGFVGLIAFLWLNYVVWVEASRLEKPWRLWVRGVILGYAAANIFNSMLLDFSEGIFFSASLAIAFSCLLDKNPRKG
jgi:O-antigen ligase